MSVSGTMTRLALVCAAAGMAAAGCKDAITTNDPRDVIVNTHVAVIAAVSSVPAGSLAVGDTANLLVTVRDTNQYAGVKILAATFSGADSAEFTVIDSAKFPLAIAAKDSAAFRVRFVAAAAGAARATLNVRADSGNYGTALPLAIDSIVNKTSAKIALLVSGLAPNGGSMNGSRDTIGKTSGVIVTLRDTSATIPVTVRSAAITGANAADFSVPAQRFPMVVAAASSDTFSVQFTPTQTRYSDTLEIAVDTSTGVNVSAPFAISGIVQANASQYNGKLCPGDTTIDFGFVMVDSTSTAGIVLSNCGTSPVRVTNIYATGADSVSFVHDFSPAQQIPFVLQPGNSTILQIRFTPLILNGHTSTLVIAADSMQDVIINLKGIGANGGMSIQPNPVNFPYDSTNFSKPDTITLEDYNVSSYTRHIDSIALHVGNPADSALFRLSGALPVTANAPSGANAANGTLTPITTIIFMGSPTYVPHYGYLEVFFRESANPVVVPIVAGP